MSLAEWLIMAAGELMRAGISSSKLDAELLLLYALRKNKSWLRAHDDEPLTSEKLKELAGILERRLGREPLAYITGEKEFHGRSFSVNRHVLVPRPETEAFITCLAELQPTEGQRLIDVGTGSGIIAITVKLGWPKLDVTGLDISSKAVRLAKQNAGQHGAKVEFLQNDLLCDVPAHSYHFITANLPYVDPSWELSPELEHEPTIALFADDEGLALVKKLLPQAWHVLALSGHLLLELDQRQHKAATLEAAKHGFTLTHQHGLILCLRRDD